VLARRARLRGIPVEIAEVNSDQHVPVEGDIYLMGGGEDLPQVLAARRLQASGGLSAAVSRGAVLFAVCAGYQIAGTEFGGPEGEPVPGLGLLDIRSSRGERRGVGEIIADVEPVLGSPASRTIRALPSAGREPSRWPPSLPGPATGTAPRVPIPAGWPAPTCTAPRWSATRAWLISCSAGSWAHCHRSIPSTKNWSPPCATSAWPLSARPVRPLVLSWAPVRGPR